MFKRIIEFGLLSLGTALITVSLSAADSLKTGTISPAFVDQLDNIGDFGDYASDKTALIPGMPSIELAYGTVIAVTDENCVCTPGMIC